MFNLVKHIRATGLDERLYAYTSHDVLVVGIYDVMEHTREALHVRFDPNQLEWHFDYYAKPFLGAEVSKTYKDDVGIKKFDDFIGYLKW